MMICKPKSALLCLTIAILLVVSPTIRAQAPTDAQMEKEAAERLELEKKTLALLNEIASGAWGLKLPENRIFIMASAADLLWTFDEKRARNLYWEAVNSVNSLSVATSKTGETLSKSERAKIAHAYFLTLSLRQRILRQIARRDSQFALDMLRASRQTPPPQLELDKAFFADERRLEQEIAGEIAMRDPAEALQLARQSLGKGLTIELLNLLQQLQQRDSEKAVLFAGEILTKLQTANIATDLRASIIALHLIQTSRKPESRNESRFGRVKELGLSDDQRRQLVELVTDAALSTSANSNLLSEITDVMPEIEQFFPERRAALERKLATFNETLTRDQRNQNTYNTLIRRGMQEDLIRVAASADDQTRASLYQQAALIAVARGQSDAFREFVGKEVSEKDERRKIFDFLDTEEISTAAGRKQLDHLRQLLPKIERKEERARAMAELAIMLKEKGEDTEAAALLDDAASLIKTNLTDERQTNALLSLLSAYAIVDPAKAFALAERTVDRANSQISMLMLVDRVVKSGAVKKSEIILDQAGIMPLDYLVFRYGKGVAALAKADFNRTKALADRFDRNELRVLAQLLIVKGLLQPPPRAQASFHILQN
ncbi:MAG TPA: hypothetical protein VFS90_07665 [Pyrinomonadaceae bacterium]|nr:hypothetical protein [Pyrinomonadaceae bacterium]